MKRPTLRVLLVVLLSITAAAAGASDPTADGWKLRTRSVAAAEPYALYQRSHPGSDFLAYLLVAHIPVPPEGVEAAVLRAVLDPKLAPEGQRRTVLRDDAKGALRHNFIPLPALFADRDIVTRTWSREDAASGLRRIEWTAVVGEGPPAEDGVVRIRDAGGHWNLEPDGRGGTRVRYETHLDLGGSLPAWLVNPLLDDAVVDSYRSVLELLSRLAD